ncbi:MAG TPA: VOC family protein [Chloroflexota bacterium]|nr:VOC family protein [Chloroflexota bacterium]
MQAHLRYLAIVSEQPAALAAYYKTFYGLRELGQSAAGDVTLTDGFYNLTIFQAQPGDKFGLHHVGVAVDDLREVEARLEEAMPEAELTPENGDLQHGECRLVDPSGLPVSLSTSGFHTPDDRRGFPAIHHIAIKVADTDAMLDFYKTVFGFREVSSSLMRRQQNWKSRFAGDGSTCFAILPLGENEAAAGNISKPGLNHFGFVVEDMEGMLARLPASGETARRPATRLQAEFRTFDPDHNGIDISQQAGFEVDFEKWARAAG